MGRKIDPQKTVQDISKLLEPIRKIIDRVLPDFVGRNLKSRAVRRKIVKVVDTALIEARPAAAAIPPKIREQIISSVLEIVLGPATAP